VAIISQKEQGVFLLLFNRNGYVLDEYSCAVTPQIRQAGNRLSGFAETTYASLFA